MWPLLVKRLNAKAACETLRNELRDRYSEEELKDKNSIGYWAMQTVNVIMNHKDSSSASAIWGKRQRLMTTLLAWCKDASLAQDLHQILQQDNVIELLNRNNSTLPKIENNSC
jgi:hypothetical protein